MKKFTKILFIIAATLVLFGETANVYSQQYAWTPLLQGSANGVNGNVYAITTYNNKVVVAGGFSQAGSTNARNIAMWDGSTWQAFGSGIGTSTDTVYSLCVYNGNLYAGGNFLTAGGSPAVNIAMWNGSAWYALATGVDSEVRAMLVFNSTLVVGGDFEDKGNKIAGWNGTAWSTFGAGFNSSGGTKVYSLAIFNSQLIAAGRMQQSGAVTNLNNISVWNGSIWQGLGTGIGTSGDRVFALTVLNSTLIAGGRFATAGGSPANNIARWTGSAWQNIGGGNAVDDEVDALAVYNNELIAGGNFKFINGLYVSRIAKWNGSAWVRMLAGPEDKVNALSVTDTSLYTGGEFVFIGGIRANHIGRWYNEQTSEVAGSVSYDDNNAPVLSGVVRAYMLDRFTKELIQVDTSVITNGAYRLPNAIHDTLRVIAFPSDEFDFVPTYYPNAVDWRNATVITPQGNLSNINIRVYKVTPGPQNPFATGTISGHIYLRINIPGNLPGSYPYQRDAVVYLKQANTYKRFTVSRDDQSFSTTSLNDGTYDLVVYRTGYTVGVRNGITIQGGNIDTINIYLDTNSVIGLENISQQVPETFTLSQNYPNPFNPTTSIMFTMLSAGTAKLTVYNALGQEAAVLVDDYLKQGAYRFVFDASHMPSGVYFYRLQTESFTDTKKMILVK
jgi:hypothetical protein